MLIIAHRCGPDKFPEQTIASARRALAHGADIVEMDVQFTKDGVPVICHDPNVKRIFGPDRKVTDMTVDEFLALRHVQDRSYASHTLEDVLTTGIGPILLHCKLVGEPLAEIVRCAARFQYGDRLILGVLDPGDIAIIRKVDPSVRTLAFMPEVTAADDFIDAGVDIIRLWEPWVTQARIDHVHAAGKALWVMAGLPQPDSVGYTSEQALRSWVDMGVDGVLVNDIDWTMSVLGRNRA